MPHILFFSSDAALFRLIPVMLFFGVLLEIFLAMKKTLRSVRCVFEEWSLLKTCSSIKFHVDSKMSTFTLLIAFATVVTPFTSIYKTWEEKKHAHHIDILIQHFHFVFVSKFLNVWTVIIELYCANLVCPSKNPYKSLIVTKLFGYFWLDIGCL